MLSVSSASSGSTAICTPDLPQGWPHRVAPMMVCCVVAVSMRPEANMATASELGRQPDGSKLMRHSAYDGITGEP